ncbi:hypothetical protein D3C72_1743080 [compost metagenome]
MPQTIEALLADQGAQAVLAYLNARVPHRYTGIYKIRADLVTSLYLHDKQGELIPENIAVVPFEASICPFVLRDGWFRTDDSSVDERFATHPGRGYTISYHGVPLLNPAGAVAGTLCHFNFTAVPLPDDEFELLHQAALSLQVKLADALC